jgi:simple sugar transport system permease protein
MKRLSPFMIGFLVMAAIAVVFLGMRVESAILIALLFSTLRQTTPLLLTALGGMFSERSGVVNIALEGMILFGAAAAAISVERIEAPILANDPLARSAWIPWVGVLVGMLTGGLVATVYAIAVIRYRAEQIVTGTAINLLAAGAPPVLMQALYNTTTNSKEVENRLVNIPIAGESISPLVFLAFLLVPLCWWVMFKTPWGLRLRAVGEQPEAADTMGINVYRMRYTAVILSGLLAGLAGAYLSIGFLNQFVKNMSAGQGFIALAALIFGKWHPLGVLGATLLFGFFRALAIQLQGGEVMPSVVVEAIPYILTILVLAGFIGRSRPPAAVGKPYEK